MNETQTQATLHREFFRRKANHRFETDILGRPFSGCEKNTRYRLYAFSSIDWWKIIEIREIGDKIALYVGGHIRTIVSSMNWYSSTHIDSFGPLDTNNKGYRICARPYDYIGGALSLQDPVSNRCSSTTSNGVYGNPRVYFYSDQQQYQPVKLLPLNENQIKPINGRYFGNTVQEVILPRAVTHGLCQDIASEDDSVPVFAKVSDTYYIHDPPPKLLSNSVTDPSPDGGSHVQSFTNDIAMCSNAPRSFLNEKHCKLSTELSACGTSYAPALEIALNDRTLNGIYNATLNANNEETRYVYAIDGLRIDAASNTDTPCQINSKSRWIPLPQESASQCTNSLDTQTKEYLSALLLSSLDTSNPYMRDIYVTSDGCASKDKYKTGYELLVIENDDESSSSMCWKHVHQDHLQVYDMTYWTYDDTHPGT